MFGAARDSVLTAWAADGESAADFLEAFRFEDDIAAAPHNFRSGHLNAYQIQDWLRNPLPRQSAAGKRLVGGFRLLICERTLYTPLDFPVTKDEFELLEREFQLPASTLATFDSPSGSYSKHLSYVDPARTKLKRIGIVIKAPQKREIANYGLSMSYDVESRFTTAVLYGTSLPCFDDRGSSVVSGVANSARLSAEYRPPSRGSSHRARSDVKPNQLIVSPADRSDRGMDAPLVKLLESSLLAWSHPLLLPSVLLTEHMRRTKLYCDYGKVMNETWEIEGTLGVTYVGRFVDRPEDQAVTTNEAVESKRTSPFASSRRQWRRTKSWQPALKAQNRLRSSSRIGRAQAEELTVRINTQSLRILFTARSPQWNRDCSSHIVGLLDELARGMSDHLNTEAHNAIMELLEYNISMAEAVGAHVASMKERMALQLDVLYSMVAQMDNRLSARLAASAGRDSTSMKILAFITALYLPAGTVATLFSMSIFAFPHSRDGNSGAGNSSGGGESIVSSWFWLFWAVAIPLTLVTLGGWAVWWRWEMQTFKRDYAEALTESDEPQMQRASRYPSNKPRDGTDRATALLQQRFQRRSLTLATKEEVQSGRLNGTTTSGAEAV